jgi:hypothetical protein
MSVYLRFFACLDALVIKCSPFLNSLTLQNSVAWIHRDNLRTQHMLPRGRRVRISIVASLRIFQRRIQFCSSYSFSSIPTTASYSCLMTSVGGNSEALPEISQWVVSRSWPRGRRNRGVGCYPIRRGNVVDESIGFRSALIFRPTRRPLRDPEVFQNPSKTLALMLTTVKFVETLENRQHSTGHIPESRNHE